MNTLAQSVERRPFQMETEHAGNLQARLSNSSQLLDQLASIADEGRQTARGPRLAVRLDDASYAVFRWLVIEKYASASVDLDVYESWGKDRICGNWIDARASASPKQTLSIRPFEIPTDPGPRMAAPSKTCGAAIVRKEEPSGPSALIRE